jgi:hypothetical protein
LHDPAGEDMTDPARPHAPERPPSGRAGRNLLYGEIGHGGMGTVFKGRDPDLGAPQGRARPSVEDPATLPVLPRSWC